MADTNTSESAIPSVTETLREQRRERQEREARKNANRNNATTK